MPNVGLRRFYSTLVSFSYHRESISFDGNESFNTNYSAFHENLKQWVREIFIPGDISPKRSYQLSGEKIPGNPPHPIGNDLTWPTIISALGGYPFVTLLLLRVFWKKREIIKTTFAGNLDAMKFGNDTEQYEATRKAQLKIKIAVIVAPLLLAFDILFFGIVLAIKLVQGIINLITLGCAGVSEVCNWLGSECWEHTFHNEQGGWHYLTRGLAFVAGAVLHVISFGFHLARIAFQTVFQPVQRARVVKHEVREFLVEEFGVETKTAGRIGNVFGGVSFLVSVVASIVLFFTPIGWGQIAKGCGFLFDKLSYVTPLGSFLPNIFNFFGIAQHLDKIADGVGVAHTTVTEDLVVQQSTAVVLMRLVPEVLLTSIGDKSSTQYVPPEPELDEDAAPAENQFPVLPNNRGSSVGTEDADDLVERMFGEGDEEDLVDQDKGFSRDPSKIPPTVSIRRQSSFHKSPSKSQNPQVVQHVEQGGQETLVV